LLQVTGPPLNHEENGACFLMAQAKSHKKDNDKKRQDLDIFAICPRDKQSSYNM
jgi:hypothetical protein